jgi:hypothetical protein
MCVSSLCQKLVEKGLDVDGSRKIAHESQRVINLRIEKVEESLSTCGVKQGDNLASILFIVFIHAVSNSLDKKCNLKTHLSRLDVSARLVIVKRNY